MKTKIFGAILISMLYLPSSWAITPGVHQLVDYETLANAAAVRSNKEVLMPHVEIPLEMVGLDFAQRLDPKVRESLVFQRDGKTYVRWILNPEDTKYGNELIAHFAKLGLPLQIQHFFKGYQTASRSYIAENPENGAQFSVKSSTNVTGGNWRDKKQPIGEATDARLISDFLDKQNQLRPFENFVFMDEPAIMEINALDQAVVIRDLGALKQADNKKFYLPGFSALHEKVGAEIATKNGSNDPFQYWTDHYVRVAGRALGELAARTGLQFDSPHSQNFLVELDENMKPTGKLILRDMSDFYVDSSIFKAVEGKDSPFLKGFTQKENIHSAINAGFGPLHGNKKPSWVSEAKYSTWLPVFFAAFENSFQTTSGFSLSPLKPWHHQNSDYLSAAYNVENSPAFNNYFFMLKADGVVTNLGGHVRCDSLFTPHM